MERYERKQKVQIGRIMKQQKLETRKKTREMPFYQKLPRPSIELDDVVIQIVQELRRANLDQNKPRPTNVPSRRSRMNLARLSSSSDVTILISKLKSSIKLKAFFLASSFRSSINNLPIIDFASFLIFSRKLQKNL